MKKGIITAAAVAALAVAGCGSGSNVKPVTSPQQGTPQQQQTTQYPTAQQLADAHPEMVQRLCDARRIILSNGGTEDQARASFDRGYNSRAVAGEASADDVYDAMASQC